MSEAAVLVIGGSGKTGRRIVPRLQRAGVIVKSAHRNGPTPFDWTDESTWKPALEGVSAVYLVDPAYVELGGAPDLQSEDLIGSFGELARAAGASRIVLLSARDLSRMDDESLIASEKALWATGIDGTVLRPSWFMSNFAEEPYFYKQMMRGRVQLSTGQGREPFIHVDDIADVAVATLTEPEHAGETYDISGGHLMTFGEAVDAIAMATGQDVAYEPVTSEECSAVLVADGVAPDVAEFTVMLFARISEGLNADVSDGVSRVLGREPRDFASYALEAAAAGAWKR